MFKNQTLKFKWGCMWEGGRGGLGLCIFTLTITFEILVITSAKGT